MAKRPPTTSAARSVVRVLVVLLIGLWTAGTAILNLNDLWGAPLEDGMTYSRQGVILSVADGSAAAAADIRAGDRFATADPRWFKVWPSPQFESVKLVHNGVTRAVTLRTKPAALRVEDKVRLFAGASVFFVSLIVGSVLVLLRPSRMTWAFYVFCASTLLVSVGSSYFTGSSTIYWTVDIVNQYLHAVGDGAMLIFAARFPDDASVGWRKWAERAGLAVCLLYPPLLLNAWQLRFIAGQFTPPALEYVADIVYAGTYIAAIATFLTVYVQSRGQERQRIQWALIFPIVLALRTPGILRTMTPSLFTVPQWFNDLGHIAGILIPLGVAYAVIRHRVFDITFAISRTIVYGTLTSLMVAMFSLLHWFLAKQLAETQLALTASIIVAIALGFWFNAVHRNVEHLVDSTLFRQRHNAERRLARAAAALPLADSHDAVDHFLINEPVAALDLASAAVFHRDGDGRFVRTNTAVGWDGSCIGALFSGEPLVLHLLAEHAAVRVAEVAWSPAGLPSGAAAPSLAVPVLVCRQLTEIVLYGAHRNGADIDPGEERHLVPLAAGAGAAFDHLEAEALRTKVEALMREVDLKAREMEQLRADLLAQRRQKRVAKTTP